MIPKSKTYGESIRALRYAPAAKSSTVTPSFYVRNPEAHGLVSSSALSICSSTVNFCCSAHSPQLLKGPVCDFNLKI